MLDEPRTESDPSVPETAARVEADEPEDYDPNDFVDNARHDGFGQWTYATRCASVGRDGSVITQEPLPVNSERWLECTTDGSPVRVASMGRDARGQVHCFLGELDEAKAGGDPLLNVEITSKDRTGPWTLRGTSRFGDAFTVSTTSGDTGRVWPLWITGWYRTVQVVPELPGTSCSDELFGL